MDHGDDSRQIKAFFYKEFNISHAWRMREFEFAVSRNLPGLGRTTAFGLRWLGFGDMDSEAI